MPSKEYYRKLKKEAHDLYVREGMTCKEISTRINVSERSVSSWINRVGETGLFPVSTSHTTVRTVRYTAVH